jgi:hypothetical protein
VSNSTISGNSATNLGGGIYNALGKLTVNDSIVSGNKAVRVSGGDGFGEGGGIEILGGTAEVSNSTISNNNGSSGGGIDASGTVTVSNSTFSGNSVGAIINSDTLTVNNSTFSGHSGVNAEAIENFGGTLTISNSTLSGNSVGIHNFGTDQFPAGLATLENTIVANSECNNCTGPITDGGYNLDSGTTCGFDKTDPTKHSLSSTDPKLAPLANYGGPTMTMALQDDSPAIDAGAPVAADANGLSCPPPSTDQRGVSRPQGSACDIGAFELDTTPPSISAPPDITVEATGPDGATVEYGTNKDNSCSATDNADPHPVISYAPQSGSTFPIGISIVTCTATDTSGNTATAAFFVTVQDTNSPPTAAVTNGQCSTTNTASGTINLTLNDPDGDTMSLELASNSNTTLVPKSKIVLSGSGNTRTITVTAAPKKSGTATLTFNLSDGTVTVPVVITVKVGSDKNETLTGTSGTDMIFGLNGDDTINAGDGNDLACGGNGNDTLRGQDGNDTLSGALGNDRLEGGNNDDTLTGGAGADFFSGGPGTDTAADFTPSQGDTKDNSIEP